LIDKKEITMKKRIALFLVVSVLALAILSACGAVSEITTVGDVGKAFMAALRDGDHTASWNMLTPAVQTEIGGQAAWVDFATPRNFSEFSFSSTNITNNQAQMDGEAVLGADTYTVVLVLEKVGDAWKLSGINFTLK
jgi:hypothetical protein